nr:hypothetical protein [Clostridia bacterium]
MNNLKLAEIFSDGTVFQHSKPIRVFGSAFGNVTVSLDGDHKTVKAEGRWLVELDARPVGGPYTLTVTCGNESISLNNIMVGEVILFSGQSNNQLHMCETNAQFNDFVTDPLLRIFMCKRMGDGETLKSKNGWVGATPANVYNWTALAYHVGLETRESKGCAVGVIACSQGASCIQAWIDASLFVGEDADLPRETNPHKFNEAGALYEFMAKQVFPYSVGYVVWYQGESNANEREAPRYLHMLDVMIKLWREQFMDEKLRFCIVQIADYTKAGSQEYWKMMQQIQAEVPAHIPYTVSVKCADICEKDDIHPPTKWKLAKRIHNAMNL